MSAAPSYWTQCTPRAGSRKGQRAERSRTTIETYLSSETPGGLLTSRWLLLDLQGRLRLARCSRSQTCRLSVAVFASHACRSDGRHSADQCPNGSDVRDPE